MLNLASLNQRVNALTAKVNNIVPGGTQDLATTLANGDSAGANDIDMNTNDILQVGNINVTTINGSAYPPAVDTLQAVLSAGNESNLSVILKDNLVTPTSTATLSNGSLGFSVPASVTSASYSGSGLNVATGDINTVGTAGANITAVANNQTVLTLSNSQATAPPFFSPPQGVATLTTTTSTSALQLSYAGQFTVGKSVTVDLDKVQHQADGNLPFTVNTNGNLVLNAGDTTFGFKKINMCPTSTFANAEFDSVTGRMLLNNSGVGNTTNPQLTLTNTNATAGTTIGVPTIQTLKSGRNVVVGDVIGSITNWAKNYLGVLKEWFRMETVITNSSGGGGDDSSMDIYTLVNGVLSLVWRFNGADNENNSFRPIDMNGQDVKTSSGNLTISTASSSGTGTISITPKAGAFVNIPSAADASNDYIRINPFVSPNAQQILMTANNGAGQANSINLLNAQFNPFVELKADFGGAINKSVSLNVNGNGSNPNNISSYDGQTDLPFQIISTGITNGSIEFVPQSATGDLIFTGANIQSGSSGGNSGQHLRIKLNGTYYKIPLQDD